MKGTNSDYQITPETKIGPLLDRFPKLEKTLFEMAPEFKKLRNPVLKKTIARVTSLKQASAIAKIPLAEMINTLRSEAGIQEEFMTDEETVSLSKERPSWFSASSIVQSLDARPMLEKGEQPIDKFFADCKNIKVGEIYELTTPFLPADIFKTYLTPKT
jgi:hypothetical protein